MLKNFRVLIASAVALVFAIVAALAYVSPMRFPAQLAAAAKAHDALRLQQLVDFPAVDAGLKSSLTPLMNQLLTQKISASGLNVSGPLGQRLAAFAQGALDTGVGQIADQLATPQTLEAIADGQPITVTAVGRQSTPIDDIFPKDAAGSRFKVTRKYLAFSRFRYTLTNNSGHSSVDIDLVRQGLFGWRVELVTPNIALADLQGPPEASASAEPTPPPPPPPSGEAPVGNAAAQTADAGLPTQVGQCVSTTIKEVSTRLEDTPGSGSAVSFANGGYQVSYDQVPEVDASQAGDAVKMCLEEIPDNCPPGDNRGSTYKVTNLRTGGSWSLPDSEHMCGGA